MNNSETNPIDLLSIFESGVLAVTINGRPFIKVDAESHTVDSELAGIKESGIKLSALISSEDKLGVSGLLKTTESTARELDEKGWKFALYDKGTTVLAMGRGVSRLSGHVHVSPTKLRSILEAV